MLTILLGILKVIGILLLIFLGIILLIVLLLLFCPVRYRGSAGKEETEKVKARIDVTWLFHLLHISVIVNELNPEVSVRILGISPESLGKLINRFRHKKAAPEKQAINQPENTQKNTADSPEIAEAAKKESSPSSNGTADKSVTDSQKSVEEPLVHVEDNGIKKKTDRMSLLIVRTKTFLKKLLHLPVHLKDGLKQGIRKGKIAAEKISEWKAFVSGQEFREALSLVLGKFFRLIRHILPGKLSGEINFGLSDPADTGMILVFIAPFYPLYGECVQVIPDFQEKRFSFSLTFKGRIYGFMLLYVALRLFLDRNVQIIIRKIRKKEV